MHIIHVTIFVCGIVSFVAAALFTGQETGDTLWRVGVAAMLIDLACIKLWPAAKSG